MLADLPITDKYLQEWLGAHAVSGYLSLNINDDLPCPWSQLVTSLIALQSRGILKCRILPGPACAIAFLQQTNESFAPTKQHLDLESIAPEGQSIDRPSFRPSAQTTLKLRQYGFSNGQINDRLAEYLRTGTQCSDASFSSYCLRSNKTFSETLITQKTLWSPSPAVIHELASLGVPVSILSEYLPFYREAFTNQPLNEASWDQHYLTWCSDRWSQDNRNNKATSGTFMCTKWTPSPETLEQLSSEGIDRTWLDTLAMEFRLYWNEIGSKKVNWNAQFVWWSRQKWPQENRSL